MEEHQIVQLMFNGLFDIVTGSGFDTVEDVQKKKLKLKKTKTSVDDETDNKKESSEYCIKTCNTSASNSESPAEDGKTNICKPTQKKIFLGNSDLSSNDCVSQRKRKLGNESCEKQNGNQSKRSKLKDSVPIKEKQILTLDESSDSNPLQSDSVFPDVSITSEESNTKSSTSLGGLQVFKGNAELVSTNENDSNLPSKDTIKLTVTKCETDRYKETAIHKGKQCLQVCPDNPDLVVSSRRQKKNNLSLQNPEKNVQPVAVDSEERLPSLLDLPSQVTDKKDIDRESNVSSDSRASGYSRARGVKQSPRTKDKNDVAKDEILLTRGTVRLKNKLSLKRKIDDVEENSTKTKQRKGSTIVSKTNNVAKKSSKTSTKAMGKRKTASSEIKFAKKSTQRGRLNSSSRTKLKHTKTKGSQMSAKKQMNTRSSETEQKTRTRNLPRMASKISRNAYLEMSPVSTTKTKSARRKLTSKCRFCSSSHGKESSSHKVAKQSKSKSPNAKGKSKGKSTRKSDSKIPSDHQISHKPYPKPTSSKAKSKMSSSKCKCCFRKLSFDSSSPRTKSKTSSARAKSPHKSKEANQRKSNQIEETSSVKRKIAKPKRERSSKLKKVTDVDTSILKKQDKILAEHSREASKEELDVMSALCKLEDKSKTLQSQDLEELMPMRDSVRLKTNIFDEHSVFRDTHPGGVWKKLVLEN